MYFRKGDWEWSGNILFFFFDGFYELSFIIYFREVESSKKFI